jgi:predicted aconitase with swiveling domain
MMKTLHMLPGGEANASGSYLLRKAVKDAKPPVFLAVHDHADISIHGEIVAWRVVNASVKCKHGV